MSHESKHPYERDANAMVADMQKREDVLNGLEAMIEEVDQRSDMAAASEWLKGLINWARCRKGYAEQIESFAPSAEETNIAEKIGRGLVKPKVAYDDDVNTIKRVQEVLDAALEGNDYHELKNAAETAREFVKDVLVMVTSVRHNTKPVLDLKQIASVMRTMVAEDGKAMPTHCMIDLTRMAESLDMVIAQHIGEDVPVTVDAQMTTESRTAHSLGAVMSAAHVHPLDIDQTALKEVALWLNSIIANNPGFHNLGKEGYIVVPTADNVKSEVIDSIRGYLIAYGQGDHMASELRSMAALRGDLAFNNMPEWFASTWGHTSKGGFAALIYHTMTVVASQKNPKAFHISSAELGKLEEQIRNGNPMALIDHINTVTENEPK